MPRLDKTGPRGLGPRTGRGFGVCPPGFGPYGYGWGMGRGWRRYGFGPGWGYPFELSPKEEKDMLKDELDVLKEEIKDVETRLEELKKTK